MIYIIKQASSALQICHQINIFKWHRWHWQSHRFGHLLWNPYFHRFN